MTDYALVLAKRHAGKQWAINANDYDSLVMLDDNPKPSKKSLDDAWPDVKAEIAASVDAKAAAVASARAKLAALGLTPEEIAAFLG